MEPSSQWTRHSFKQIKVQVEKATEQGKCVVIKDEAGNVPAFFQYTGTLVEVYKLKMQMLIAGKSKEDVLEELRVNLIGAMRFGKSLCLHMGKVTWDFKSEMNDATKFPSDKVFDLPQWKDNSAEHWRPLIHNESEDTDYTGLNKGTFDCQPDFNIVIVTDCESEAEVAELMAGIPHAEKFVKFVVA